MLRHFHAMLDPILNQPNPVRLIDPYLPKVHLNVILPLRLGIPSGLYSLTGYVLRARLYLEMFFVIH
jgi:hypothetical protein